MWDLGPGGTKGAAHAGAVQRNVVFLKKGWRRKTWQWLAQVQPAGAGRGEQAAQSGRRAGAQQRHGRPAGRLHLPLQHCGGEGKYAERGGRGSDFGADSAPVGRQGGPVCGRPAWADCPRDATRKGRGARQAKKNA